MTAQSDPKSDGVSEQAAESTQTDQETVAAEAPQEDVALVEEPDELTAVTRQRDEYLDSLRRLQAEFENYKKRLARQQSDFAMQATEKLIRDLLPVLDTLDLALEHDPSGPLEQVSSGLRSVLGNEGVVRVDRAGIAFDPTVHDAVDHEPGDNPAEVIEVLRSGYRWKDKVLRPAMVRVKGS